MSSKGFLKWLYDRVVGASFVELASMHALHMNPAGDLSIRLPSSYASGCIVAGWPNAACQYICELAC